MNDLSRLVNPQLRTGPRVSMTRFIEKKPLLFIILTILFFYLPCFILGKSLYSIAEGRSSSFDAANGVVRSIRNPIYLDHGACDWIEAPLLEASKRSISSNELPLWNPFNGLGMPLLANINSSILAPLGFYLNFVNSDFFWNVMYVSRLIFAAIFTFLFIKKLGVTVLASVSGALLFAFCGYSQLSLNMFHFHVDACLPFLLWATINYKKRTDAKAIFFLSMSIVFINFGGNPQNLILSLMLACSFFLTISAFDNKVDNIKPCVLYFIIMLLSFGICQFYWLPFVEIFQRALKYHANAGVASLPISSWFGLFFPVFYTNASLGSIFLPYIGLFTVPVIFSGISLEKSQKKYVLFFGAVVVLLLLKIVGTPIVNLIGRLPILDNILFMKYTSVLYFSIAVLFAFSAQNIAKRFRIGVFLVPLAGSLVISILAYLYITDGRSNSFFVYTWACLLSLMLFCFCLLRKKKKSQLSAIFIIIFLELFSIHLYSLRSMVDYNTAFRVPKFVEYIQRDRKNMYDRVFGVGKILMGNLASFYGLHDIRLLSATIDNNYYMFMKNVVLNNKIDIHPFETTSSEFFIGRRSIMDMLGVKYIIIENCDKNFDKYFNSVYNKSCVKIYKNESAYERAFVVHDYIQFENDSAVLEFMKSGNVNYKEKALTLRGDVINFGHADSETSSEKDSIDIINYKFNSVAVRGILKQPGILILSDLYYPGWNVYVDGMKGHLIKVNFILRGVELGAGKHLVEFRYEPKPFYLGLKISLVSLFLLCCLLGFLVSVSKNRVPATSVTFLK